MQQLLNFGQPHWSGLEDRAQNLPKGLLTIWGDPPDGLDGKRFLVRIYEGYFRDHRIRHGNLSVDEVLSIFELHRDEILRAAQAAFDQGQSHLELGSNAPNWLQS